MAEQKPALFARIDPATKSAMEATAARLGVSAATYLEGVLKRAVIEDASKVALSNARHDEEVARLSESANDLIALAHRHDAARGSK